jgi:hypothetical protein
MAKPVNAGSWLRASGLGKQRYAFRATIFPLASFSR